MESDLSKFLEPEWAGLRLGGPLLEGPLMGFDEVAHCTNNHITQGNIGMIGNGLQKVFFVRGNADCHDPIAALRHEINVFEEIRLSMEKYHSLAFFMLLSYL